MRDIDSVCRDPAPDLDFSPDAKEQFERDVTASLVMYFEDGGDCRALSGVNFEALGLLVKRFFPDAYLKMVSAGWF